MCVDLQLRYCQQFLSGLGCSDIAGGCLKITFAGRDRTKPLVSQEVGKRVESLIEENCRYGKKEIVSVPNISPTSVLTLLHWKLDPNKITCQWVPRTLMPQNKHKQMASAEEFLELCQAYFEGAVWHMVTGDKTGMDEYDRDSKQ